MKYVYNPNQFKYAVKYIAKKNIHFKDDIPKVTQILNNLIKSAIKYDKRNLESDRTTWVGTAGFTVHICSLYDDTQLIEILVDPSVSKTYKEVEITVEDM